MAYMLMLGLGVLRLQAKFHERVFQVKQNHSLFPKAFVEEALKEAPRVAHIALEGTTQCEVTLIAVGY
jgi:hypothetical protein